MNNAMQKLKKIILEETNLYLKEIEDTDLGVPFSDDISNMSEESMTEEILRVLRKSDFYNLAKEEYSRDSGQRKTQDADSVDMEPKVPEKQPELPSVDGQETSDEEK